MVDDLSTVMEEVHLHAAAMGAADGESWMDQALGEQKPTKGAKPLTADDVRRDIEELILKPKTSFSAEWLNKLQQ